jgi:hypothetical protein
MLAPAAHRGRVAANSPAHCREMRRRAESSPQTADNEFLTGIDTGRGAHLLVRLQRRCLPLGARHRGPRLGDAPFDDQSSAQRYGLKMSDRIPLRRHATVRSGWEGRSKSRMTRSLATSRRIVSTSTSTQIYRSALCNAASMWIGNAATPLAICRDVGNATHGTHGSQRTSSQQRTGRAAISNLVDSESAPRSQRQELAKWRSSKHAAWSNVLEA